MHAGLLDVFHHTTDQHLTGVVANRVDVDLDGVLEESIDENRSFGRQASFLAEAAEAGEFGHGAGQVLAIVHDLHGPTSQHVTRPHQHRETHSIDDRLGFGQGDRGSARRLRDRKSVAELVPLLAVLGEVDRLG